jgi:hypothetical protein
MHEVETRLEGIDEGAGAGRRSEIGGVGQNGEEFAYVPPNPGVLMHEHMRSRSSILHAELIW